MPNYANDDKRFLCLKLMNYGLFRYIFNINQYLLYIKYIVLYQPSRLPFLSF